MFSEIILHDFSRPLAKRAEGRKRCGPYRWTPTKPGGGRGFYTDSALTMARHGGGMGLRLSLANDHLSGRAREITGYYCDADGDGDTLQPIVATLPGGRGFLAGWTMGAGMASSLAPDLYETPEEAARAAHSEAESAAEEGREYSEANNAGFQWAELGEAIKAARLEALRILKERRRAMASGPDFPAIRQALRAKVADAVADIERMRAEREELRALPWSKETRAAFNEGAGLEVFA